MRALIVDDEPWARRGVALRLKRLAGVDVIGECGDGYSAIATILDLSPDVVFLDVEMPGMDGFEVLRALPADKLPGVVFLTAHKEYALRAFEVHALDYLLKPIDDEKFAAAVTRVTHLLELGCRGTFAEQVRSLMEERFGKYASRFAVRLGLQIQIVHVEDVEWVASAGNYVELHSKGRAHLLRETMSVLEERLDPTRFIRIHRSRIIQLGCIRELRFIDNREYLIRLSDGSEHRSSRTYADQLEAWLAAKR
jgi:two-component system LytT family response regulator